MNTEKAFDRKTVLALGVTLLFWGSSFPGIRAALPAFNPRNLALIRYVSASLVLLVYALLSGMRSPRLRDVPALVLIGVVGMAFYHVILNYGAEFVSAGAAAFLVNTAPIFTALLAWLFLKERLGLRGWIGIAVSFAGAFLIALGEGSGLKVNIGTVLVLAAAVALSLFFFFQKIYLRTYTPLEFTAYATWAGTIPLLFVHRDLSAELHMAGAAPLVAVLYLGVFPTAVAYITWAHVMAKLPASRAVSFLYLVPAIAMAVAWIWLGELPALLTVIGGFLALGGVVIVNRRPPAGLVR